MINEVDHFQLKNTIGHLARNTFFFKQIKTSKILFYKWWINRLFKTMIYKKAYRYLLGLIVDFHGWK